MARLTAWADTGPGRRSQWVLGFGYDDAMLVGKNHPAAVDLDLVPTDKPTLAVHQSFHLGAVNSAGLRLLGFTHETPDPEGGVIRRISGSGEPGWVPPHGVPNGVLEESAFNIAYAQAGAGIALEDQAGFFERGRQVANRYGFTTVQDGGVDLPVLDFMRDEARAATTSTAACVPPA
ncbi:putative amidohydrolase YtcJ [Catenulispora sp. EB89]